MEPEILDGQQLLALEPDVQLVEAGPGAGKTRTIVERMRRHSSDLKKGVALISFTNTAADEAKKRCTPAQLAVPNYVGTVDSFLHKFVVTPAISLRTRKSPKYVTSWHELPDEASIIRLGGAQGAGFRLGSFKINVDGSVSIGNALSQNDRGYLAVCERADRYDELIALGQKCIQRLLNNGTFDSDGARIRALQLLSENDKVIASRLAARFEEVIIDEFQDCSDVEVKIVEQLKAAGVNVVVVADPDQAIYEFRDASPDSYRKFREGLDQNSIVLLEGNYRSSPAICGLVTALRSVGSGYVISNRPHFSDKVVVLAGSHEYQRTQFAEQLTARGIQLENSIILAHERKQAREIAGLSVEHSSFAKSDHKTFIILGSIIAIKAAEGPRLRKSAIDRAQKVILGLINWNPGEQRLSPPEQLELLEITRSHIASFLLDLLSQSSDWSDASSATASIRDTADAHFGELSRGLSTPSRSLTALKPKQWQVWLEALETETPPSTFHSSAHIHAVKGNEYRAVLLSVEKRRGKDGVWDMIRSGETNESLRVLYVGASRAADLLALGCTANEALQLTGVLDDKKVEYELFQES